MVQTATVKTKISEKVAEIRTKIEGQKAFWEQSFEQDEFIELIQTPTEIEEFEEDLDSDW